MVRIDADCFAQIVINLVDNAIRYTPRGGVVTVSCGFKGGQPQLRVEDSGPGIPDAQKDSVFTRFYRLDQTQSGSGLGLAIVRDIATDHGAGIEVGAGTGGRGTLFRVVFPALPAEATA